MPQALSAALQELHGSSADRDVRQETISRLNVRISELVMSEQAARADVEDLQAHMERLQALHQRDLQALERAGRRYEYGEVGPSLLTKVSFRPDLEVIRGCV